MEMYYNDRFEHRVSSQVPKLDILSISGCLQLTESGLNKLVTKLVELRGLDLSFCHISDATLVLIAHNMTKINELHVNSCRVTDVGAREFLAHSKSIKMFDVRECSQVCIVDYPNVNIIR